MSGRGFGAAMSAEAEAGGSQNTASFSAALFRQQFAQVASVIAGSQRDSGDATPCQIYSTTGRVSGRWPPRATAALDAFLSVKREGRAKTYAGEFFVIHF